MLTVNDCNISEVVTIYTPSPSSSSTSSLVVMIYLIQSGWIGMNEISTTFFKRFSSDEKAHEKERKKRYETNSFNPYQ